MELNIVLPWPTTNGSTGGLTREVHPGPTRARVHGSWVTDPIPVQLKKHNVKELSSQLQLFLTRKRRSDSVFFWEIWQYWEKKAIQQLHIINNYGEVWFKRMEAEWKLSTVTGTGLVLPLMMYPQGPGVPPTWGQNQSLGCQTGDSIQLYPNYLPSIFSWLNLS